jgi:hypothetical protein
VEIAADSCNHRGTEGVYFGWREFTLANPETDPLRVDLVESTSIYASIYR